jgi:hypothetical protein
LIRKKEWIFIRAGSEQEVFCKHFFIVFFYNKKTIKTIFQNTLVQKSLEGHSALKKGQMEIMFEFIRTEMDL